MYIARCAGSRRTKSRYTPRPAYSAAGTALRITRATVCTVAPPPPSPPPEAAAKPSAALRRPSRSATGSRRRALRRRAADAAEASGSSSAELSSSRHESVANISASESSSMSAKLFPSSQNDTDERADCARCAPPVERAPPAERTRLPRSASAPDAEARGSNSLAVSRAGCDSPLNETADLILRGGLPPPVAQRNAQ